MVLLPEIPTVITPLVDKKAETVDRPSQYKVAVFCSISNCKSGLRGVSMGNFLIKRESLSSCMQNSLISRPS
ncbi:malonyl-CoA decarboxylase domain-containing protein [Polynucleobacter necessarius]|uniref:malonyl-CoA decarboxylase domain-containing protein n=1 Tax=Polynucleobacter necessarius TaxID=576610 RepID=UPI001E606A0C|nr:malonyl-CoA decarboxylase family protein [Polynucleobacter necessarius]